jgi:hypothetical protein
MNRGTIVNRMVKHMLAFMALPTMLALGGYAHACGACPEDKVAATYDHAMLARAAARQQVVVFAAIEGGGDARKLARVVKAAAARAPGVDRDSVRTAAEPSALAFALDPRVATPDAALATIEKSTAAHDVKLPLLRIVR